ncbi:MAG: aminotransferase class I/II-fold pyridoxal phosphate-dependent enzyme [Acutalibacteraceae bacterium]
MTDLTQATKQQLTARREELLKEYESYKARGLQLDMSRGKPGPEQLDLTLDMLECVNARDGYRTRDGIDTRNYGLLDGIPEAKELFADILGVSADNIIVGGNSSLNMMFDYIATAYAKGVCGQEPWGKQGAVKFLCPAPGYDRHFAITEYFGIDMITVPMTQTGPDMDMVEKAVADPLVKGIWCVPMYSNPEGVTYSDETVRRFAALAPAAEDFRIMWDNAYCVHHLTDTPDHLLNIFDEAKATGREDMIVEFTSTSKISFPGSGLAAMAASARNIADVKSRMTVQTIGYDKLNMLRHMRFFGNADGVREHMKLHAALLRPRFELVLSMLRDRLGGKGIASWHEPKGGYFVSVNLLDGCASETARLLKEAGVVITGAGATYPYGNDPHDSNIRLAPTFPPIDELKTAMELFCLCAELAATERLLEKNER